MFDIVGKQTFGLAGDVHKPESMLMDFVPGALLKGSDDLAWHFDFLCIGEVEHTVQLGAVGEQRIAFDQHSRGADIPDVAEERFVIDAAINAGTQENAEHLPRAISRSCCAFTMSTKG